MKKILIVVDMQNDFIDGSLGTPEAQKIVGNVIGKIENSDKNSNRTNKDWDVVFATVDTHDRMTYNRTLEGKLLPVSHCIINTDGWKINDDVLGMINYFDEVTNYNAVIKIIEKPTFGSYSLIDEINSQIKKWFNRNEIYSTDDVYFEICGLCTDICVISNALMIRAAFPNSEITCDSSCCAGVTPEKHEAALDVMRSCQINVI